MAGARDDELELHVGVAKVAKYATGDSGDTVEVIERPHGGISLAVVDGQRSGRAAKLISNLVARKAVSLLAEGVRDGAVARAAHDYLRAHRQGKVSAELSIVSVDLATRTVVVSRNTHCPVLLLDPGGLHRLDAPSQPIGVHGGTKPVITEVPVAADTWVVAFTDGVLHAGRRVSQPFDVAEVVLPLVADSAGDAPALADAILARAIELDQGRPQDDMSVLVLGIVANRHLDGVRRMTMRFPLPPF
jgi:serine phosphatase RsbU (regulator of sigma subunit)